MFSFFSLEKYSETLNSAKLEFTGWPGSPIGPGLPSFPGGPKKKKTSKYKTHQYWELKAIILKIPGFPGAPIFAKPS